MDFRCFGWILVFLITVSEGKSLRDRQVEDSPAPSEDITSRCPCLSFTMCPRIYGKSVWDLVELGPVPDCLEEGTVRCCGVSVTVSHKYNGDDTRSEEESVSLRSSSGELLKRQVKPEEHQAVFSPYEIYDNRKANFNDYFSSRYPSQSFTTTTTANEEPTTTTTENTIKSRINRVNSIKDKILGNRRRFSVTSSTAPTSEEDEEINTTEVPEVTTESAYRIRSQRPFRTNSALEKLKMSVRGTTTTTGTTSTTTEATPVKKRTRGSSSALLRLQRLQLQKERLRGTTQGTTTTTTTTTEKPAEVTTTKSKRYSFHNGFKPSSFVMSQTPTNDKSQVHYIYAAPTSMKQYGSYVNRQSDLVTKTITTIGDAVTSYDIQLYQRPQQELTNQNNQEVKIPSLPQQQRAPVQQYVHEKAPQVSFQEESVSLSQDKVPVVLENTIPLNQQVIPNEHEQEMIPVRNEQEQIIRYQEASMSKPVVDVTNQQEVPTVNHSQMPVRYQEERPVIKFPQDLTPQQPETPIAYETPVRYQQQAPVRYHQERPILNYHHHKSLVQQETPDVYNHETAVQHSQETPDRHQEANVQVVQPENQVPFTPEATRYQDGTHFSQQQAQESTERYQHGANVQESVHPEEEAPVLTGTRYQHGNRISQQSLQETFERPQPEINIQETTQPEEKAPLINQEITRTSYQHGNQFNQEQSQETSERYQHETNVPETTRSEEKETAKQQRTRTRLTLRNRVKQHQNRVSQYQLEKLTTTMLPETSVETTTPLPETTTFSPETSTIFTPTSEAPRTRMNLRKHRTTTEKISTTPGSTTTSKPKKIYSYSIINKFLSRNRTRASTTTEQPPTTEQPSTTIRSFMTYVTPKTVQTQHRPQFPFFPTSQLDISKVIDTAMSKYSSHKKITTPLVKEVTNQHDLEYKQQQKPTISQYYDVMDESNYNNRLAQHYYNNNYNNQNAGYVYYPPLFRPQY